MPAQREIREERVYRNFIISAGLAIVMGITGVFFGLAVRSHSLVQAGILARARSHFQGIVVTRKWNALHGGVFVAKSAGMKSNPYLKDPDMRGADGQTYTRKNPALMTREISELSREQGLFSFHITSLKPLNPGNAPDAFEKKAMELFEGKKAGELYGEERINGRLHYRYMAPLVVEKSCLQCHAVQGYREGDIRGGISVLFDIDDSHRGLRRNFVVIFLLTLLTNSVLFFLVFFFFRKLRQKLRQARRLLARMATTDSLTGLLNRQHTMERFQEEQARSKRGGTSLCCILLDIDLFKAVNDSHGHLAGDAVLRQTARILKKQVRAYDILGRFGGEEFIVVLPDTSLADAELMAERIRSRIEARLGERSSLPPGSRVTVSLGLTVGRAGDADPEALIARADAALYRAKERGRNRVEVQPGE
jgi:diguanylate cyclase (GGDEF)-like protein